MSENTIPRDARWCVLWHHDGGPEGYGEPVHLWAEEPDECEGGVWETLVSACGQERRTVDDYFLDRDPPYSDKTLCGLCLEVVALALAGVVIFGEREVGH